jgi:uncharacterized membrane protein YoaK (UPF0700 family)
VVGGFKTGSNRTAEFQSFSRRRKHVLYFPDIEAATRTRAKCFLIKMAAHSIGAYNAWGAKAMDRPLAASRATVLLFTWAAGSVDAIAYLSARVFTANMTGNAVLLGISAGQGKGTAAASSLIALAAFVGGVMLGAWVVGEGDTASASTDVRRAVWLETFLLGIFTVVCFAPVTWQSRTTVLLLIISSGVAMGVQSAAVRRLKLPGIATTYITGTITSLFSGLVHHWRRAPNDAAEALFSDDIAKLAKPGTKDALILQAEVFLSYTMAALGCAVLHSYWPTGVAVLPLIAIIAVDVSLGRRRGAEK